MIKINLSIAFILILLNFSVPANSANFTVNIDTIKREINRDNISGALKLLGEIKVEDDEQQEKIDLLFGDIYLKINKPKKSIEFYEKVFITSDENIESLSELGLSEASLSQGKLNEAIEHAERSLALNSDNVKTKIILAIAQTRNGEHEQALKALEVLHDGNRNNSEVNLALASYYISFGDSLSAIKILERFNQRKPDNIRVLDELANLYWASGDKEKALEYKFKVYKYHEFNRNQRELKQSKQWILSIDPKYFDKPQRDWSLWKKKNKKYEDEEIKQYEKRKKKIQYEEIDFAPNFTGSGFIVGKGNFVITNNHVIEKAKRIAVRNGTGRTANAEVVAVSTDYDLAILKLDRSYKEYLNSKDFVDPIAGQEVVSIGYPMTSIFGNDLPVITEGIISKVFDDDIGFFLTTTNINQGNSGGPIFNLNGHLVGISASMLDKERIRKLTGTIPNAMGMAIKSNMLKEVFKFKKTIPVRNVNYSKSQLYEDMIPKIVFIAVLADVKNKK